MDRDPLPWFPLYVNRFMDSRRLRRMDAAQIGIYTLLICEEWRGGPIPDDPDAVAFLARCKPSDAIAVLEQCFKLNDDGWICPELEEIRAEQEERRDRYAEAGRLGGLAKARNAASDALPGKPSNALLVRVEEKKEEEKKKEKTPPTPPEAFLREFEKIWEAYPLKIGKKKALKAYQARRREGTPAESITAGLDRYLAWAIATDTKLKHAATFLGPDEWWSEPWEITEADRIGKKGNGQPEEFTDPKYRREYIPDLHERPKKPSADTIPISDPKEMVADLAAKKTIQPDPENVAKRVEEEKRRLAALATRTAEA